MVTNRFKALSPIDAVAGLVTLIALGGVIWSPKLTNAVAKATGSLKPVQVSVDVRTLITSDPQGLLESVRDEGALNIVVRNQPAGRLTLVSVDDLTRSLIAVQPDGSLATAVDPNASTPRYVRFVLKADADVKPSGVVLGGTKLKIGVPVEVEGRLYRLNGVVSGVQTL